MGIWLRNSLVGLSVVIIIMGCMSYRSLQDANIESIRHKNVSSIVSDNVGEDYMIGVDSVSYDRRARYNMLSFDSAEDFICSLQSTVYVSGADTLYKVRVYDYNDNSIVSIYESPDEKVSVAVDEDGSVAFCKFRGVSENVENKIRKLIKSRNNNTDFRIKIINGGFMLEQSTTA